MMPISALIIVSRRKITKSIAMNSQNLTRKKKKMMMAVEHNKYIHIIRIIEPPPEDGTPTI